MQTIKKDYQAAVAAQKPLIQPAATEPTPTPTPVPPSPAPTPPAPVKPELPPPRYTAKPSFNVVRVRLFPLFKRDTPSMDPFVTNATERKLTLKNAEGLQLVDVATKKLLAKGNKITFDLALSIILVDDKKVSALAKAEVLPLVRGSGTVVVGLKESSTNTDGYFKYEGSFVFLKTSVINGSGSVVNTWNLVNFVYLEDYITAVTPSEVPIRWLDPSENAVEAVKAQAVAARSYALNIITTSRKSSTREWDVVPTTANQAYMGIRFLTDQAREIIATTAGLVLTFDDRIILAAFSANSGGHTCSALDCWGTSLPYLAAVKDVPEVRNLPGGYAQFAVAPTDFQKALKANRIIINVNSPAQKIEILKTNSSQRVTQITAQVAGKVFNLNAAQTASVLDSACRGYRFLEFGPLENGNFMVTKYGFGHAIGMSQWGAYAQSRTGKNYEEILKFYYTGTHVDTLLE